jgi:spore germination cell wall hydrolase CwlJ-like protein
MLSRAVSLVCLGGAIVLAPALADAAGRPSKAARLIGIAANHAAMADHPVMDLPPGLRRQVLCTALNVYHEARGSTRRDQISVALVTRNRALHEERSYCSVVWERAQFSWTRYRVRRLIPRDDVAWDRALTRAMAVVANPSPTDITRGARHFYNPRLVRPRWARPGKVVAARRIGQHRYVRLRDPRWYK